MVLKRRVKNKIYSLLYPYVIHADIVSETKKGGNMRDLQKQLEKIEEQYLILRIAWLVFQATGYHYDQFEA